MSPVALLALRLVLGRGVLEPQSNKPTAFRLARHAPLDDVEAQRPAAGWSATESLWLVAAPGESERAAFVVHAGGRGGVLDVEIVASGPSFLAGATTVRHVVRQRVRSYFAGVRTERLGRWAPRFVPHRLVAGDFREIWVEVTVPERTPPGVYEADVVVTLGRQQRRRRVRVRIRDVRLQGPGTKALGMVYRVHRFNTDAARMRRELRDIREHGVSNLVLDARPVFGWGPARVLQVDVEPLRRVLAVVRELGFEGYVVVDSGFVPLARMLGHKDVAYVGEAGGSLLTRGQPFEHAARKTLRAVEQLQRPGDRFALAVTHLDEVFERGRLPLFERLAGVGVRMSGLPVYAALSTARPEYDALRARIDPLVDIRSHHGYSFEWWLMRGGSAEAFAREVETARDEAWFYHNERGSYFTGRWARLVNGLYLWASPFACHVTWAYQAFAGSPFDDEDGQHHDFGMAFPAPDAPHALVPTRIWSALGEGHDDLRYLAALERALAEHGPYAPEVAAQGQAFLDRLRRDVMRIPLGVDVPRLPRKLGTPLEAPLLHALAGRYDDAALAWVRTRIEEYVVALRVAARRHGADAGRSPHSGRGREHDRRNGTSW